MARDFAVKSFVEFLFLIDIFGFRDPFAESCLVDSALVINLLLFIFIEFNVFFAIFDSFSLLGNIFR